MKNQVESKKSTLKQQILSAISMLIVAAVALTGATYAWFTFVANPEITDIELYVRAADELYLSPYHSLEMDPDATGYGTSPGYTDPYFQPDLWFAEITKGMIANGDGINPAYKQDTAFPILMKDVSSIFTEDVNGRDFYTRKLDNQGNPEEYIAAEQYSVEGEGYVQFDLWAKSSSSGIVYLDNQTAKSWIKAINEYGASVDTPITDAKKKFIENAVRVGFYTACEDASSATTVVPRAVLWEPNSNTHLPSYLGGPTLPGRLETLAITQTDLIPTPVPIVGTIMENMAAGGEGGKTAQTLFDFLGGQTNYFNAPGGPSRYTDRIALFHIDAGHAVKFTICIWIEGADADTVNNVASSFFRTNLMFGLEKEQTAIDHITKTLGASVPAPSPDPSPEP